MQTHILPVYRRTKEKKVFIFDENIRNEEDNDFSLNKINEMNLRDKME